MFYTGTVLTAFLNVHRFQRDAQLHNSQRDLNEMWTGCVVTVAMIVRLNLRLGHR